MTQPETAAGARSARGRPGDGSAADTGQIHAAHETYPRGEISSIGEIVADITRDMSTLLRQEVALAKAELRSSASSAGKGAGMLGGAALAGWFTLLFASLAIWWWLGNVMDRGLAALIVTALWALTAGVLYLAGRNQLSQIDGIPQTVETAKAVPAAMAGNEDAR